MSVVITWKSGVYHRLLYMCRAYVELRQKLSDSECSYFIFETRLYYFIIRYDDEE
jgi:uncharacterized membrane protein